MNLKKSACFSISLFLLSFFGVQIVFLAKGYSQIPSQNYCAFCDPKVLDAQTFYEDSLVLALYTHKPIFPGHCLVISKRHVERFELLTDEEILQIGQVIRKVNQAAMKVFNTSSYLLLQKNGVEVGQTVPHVHFHYVPRKTGDSSTLKFLLNMFASNALKPIDAAKMRHAVETLREAMQENRFIEK